MLLPDSVSLEDSAKRAYDSLMKHPCDENLYHYWIFFKEIAKQLREIEEEPKFRREWAL